MYQLATTLPFMVCLVWTAILFVQFRSADRAHRALAVFGVAATLLYFCHYLHFNGLQSLFSESLYYLCNLSVYPLYAMYVKSLTGKEKPGRWNLLWLVPAVVMFVISLTGVVRSSLEVQLAVQILFPVVSIAATIVAFIDLYNFRESVENFYSNPGEKRLDPLLAILILLAMASVGSFTVNILGRDHFMATERLIVPALFFSALLFSIFYFGNKTDLPVEDVRVDDSRSKADNSDASAYASIMDRIHRQMEFKQIFRSKGLTVAELAEAVGSNRSYVSASINQTTGQNFSDYVNSWRIEYAKKLMQTTEMTLAEIADAAGFTDRTSFYRSFKKITGMSPSEWLK